MEVISFALRAEKYSKKYGLSTTDLQMVDLVMLSICSSNAPDLSEQHQSPSTIASITLLSGTKDCHPFSFSSSHSLWLLFLSR